MFRYILIIIFSFIAFNCYATKWHPNKNMVQILDEGTTSLAKRIQLIRSATKSIDVEYYIYARDRIGRLIFGELIKKAKQKVKVRILVDGHKLLSEIDEYEAMELAKHNIELRFFNRTGIFRLIKGQFRNHRKSLTIDNKFSIIGGRNIAESYYNLNRKYNFLDRDILISGPIVKDITSSFETFWNSEFTLKWKKPFFEEGRIRIRYDRYNTDNDDEVIRRHQLINPRNITAANFISLDEASDKLATEVLKVLKEHPLKEAVECRDARIISDKPNIYMGERRSSSDVGIFMREIFRSAQENIIVDNPYFLNFNPFKSIFDQKLLHENVTLSLFTNGLNSTENLTVYTTFYPQSEDFIKMGMKLYLHKGQFHKDHAYLIEPTAKGSVWGSHSKTFIVDNTFIIGTFNMDPHSYKWNTEILLVCEDATELIEQFQETMRNRLNVYHNFQDSSAPRNYHQNATIGKRLKYWLTKFPAKLIEDLL